MAASSSNVSESAKDMLQLFEYPSFITICSKRNSGKSFMLERLVLKDWDKFDEVVLMSGTVTCDKDEYPYLKWLAKSSKKPMYIGAFNLGVLMGIEARQKKSPAKHVLIILDDIIPVLKGPSLQYISNFSTVSRHYNMTLIICLQTANLTFTPQMRSNVDYLLFSRLTRKMLEYVNEVLQLEKKTLFGLAADLDDFNFILYDNHHNHADIRKIHFT